MKNGTTVTLGEVLNRSDVTVDIDPLTTYKQVTVRLWGNGVVLRDVVAGSDIAGSRRFLALPGQFIISRIDARNGASGVVPNELAGAVVTNDFPLFTVDDTRLEPRFLSWLSKTNTFVELCQQASEGTTNRVRLQEERFLALRLSLPSLPEQRRMVGRIERLAGKVAEAREFRVRASVETSNLLGSYITSLFDSLTSNNRQAIRTLGWKNTNPIQIGPFGAQLHKSEFTAEGVPVLNVGNVWPDGLRLDYVDHVTTEKADQLVRYRIREGDLLFARCGATLGKVCIVPRECDGWLMTGHLFRIRFDQVRVLNRFAFAALTGARQIQEQVFDQVRGATRPGYNTTLLGNVEMPIPSLNRQNEIVAELDTLQSKVDALKRLQSETAAELDALLPSILDKAFKGEL